MPALQEPLVANGDRDLVLFCDFENIALGVRDSKYADLQTYKPGAASQGVKP